MAADPKVTKIRERLAELRVRNADLTKRLRLLDQAVKVQQQALAQAVAKKRR
jgi:hypothetical protein